METIKAPCSNCLTGTSHNILHSLERDVEGMVDDDGTCAVELFQLIECAGCGRISFAHSTPNPGFDEQSDDEHARDEYYVDYYPSPVSRKKPRWAEPKFVFLGSGLTYELSKLLSEIYEAVWAGQHRLASMGIRALLEQAMIDKVGDRGSFSRNLEAFCEKGFISEFQRNAMGTILNAGHASTHRMFEPTTPQKSCQIVFQCVGEQEALSLWRSGHGSPTKTG
jgi:Domain of unknown function (DUF4145)